MPIHFTCPHCHTRITAPESAAGKEDACPQCGATVQAPAVTPLAPEAEERVGFETPLHQSPGMQPCPQCGQAIRAEAIFCKHCRTTIAPQHTSRRPSPDMAHSPGSQPVLPVWKRPWVRVLGVLGLLLCATLVIGDLMTTNQHHASRDDQGATGGFGAFCASATPVNYETLARGVDQMGGQHVVIRGQVTQIIAESGDQQELQLNITPQDYGWDDPVYVTYTQGNQGQPRLIEDDIVTCWGSVEGMAELQLVDGSTRTVPQIDAQYLRLAKAGQEFMVDHTVTITPWQIHVTKLHRCDEIAYLGLAQLGHEHITAYFTITNLAPHAIEWKDTVACSVLTTAAERFGARIIVADTQPNAPEYLGAGQSYQMAAEFLDVPMARQSLTLRFYGAKEITAGTPYWTLDSAQYTDITIPF